MTVDHDCEGGEYSRAKPFVDSDDLRRRNCTCGSFSLPHSHDDQRSSESIYNAIRVPTPSHSVRRSGTAYDMGPLMEEGLAANVAMFISSDSSDDPSSTQHRPPQYGGKTVETVWWRSHMGSDQVSHRPPYSSSLLADTQHSRRRAISLDATTNNCSDPNWPGNLGSAVKTVRPLYPPPKRSPTPPGLPSFNTPEAVHCSSQILVGQGGQNGRRQGIPGERATSYGDFFRGFFGLSHSSGPGQGSPRPVGIGRAEDGTLVLGRFPYRHSGHGTYMARQLQDHPFHQNALPVAECESEIHRDESDLEAANTKETETLSRSRRRVRILTPPSIRRLWPTSNGPSTSIPENVALVRARNPTRPVSLLGLRQTSPRLDVPSRASPSTGEVESSVQGVGLMGARDPSIPAQLQSVLEQNRSEERVNPASRGQHAVSDAVFWLPSQLYAHCCLGNHCVHESREDLEALDVVASGDTYTTAREHQSGYMAWMSSMYHRVWPRSSTSDQAPV